MSDFKVYGEVAETPITLTLHRGESMCLLAMNWRVGQPPDDFVGFAIEFMEPNGNRYFALRNRLAFTDASKITDKTLLSTKLCPIQKFRWIHFPENASLAGSFTYRVTPVFMSDSGELSYGISQTAAIVLASETYPGQLDIGFTRGFISSQAFVDRYGKTAADIATLIPPKATSGANGLDFESTNPKAKEAYDWMGFEARKAILVLLDAAIADGASKVCVIAYDLNEAEVVSRIEQLKGRVKIIIDDSGTHGEEGSAENEAARRIAASAGAANVKRQKLGGLQHNKFIVVDAPTVKRAICGSTNYSWRAFFVQSNNTVTVTGAAAIAFFQNAFDAYWTSEDSVSTFEAAGYDVWQDLQLANIDAKVTFSPHSLANSVLQPIANDIASTTSSLLYSLAFLYETPGPIKTAITSVTDSKERFVYGISDRKVGGLDVTVPDGNTGVVYPEALSANVPPPFSEEPTAGAGARMHHKFVVIDFDKPSARVYVGSFNFSGVADRNNGENLLLIRDRLATTSYAVEALSLFDHYHFRLKSNDAHDQGAPLVLTRPPPPGVKPWFADDYEVEYKIRDRQLFSQ
ncbi:phospholipase [Caballeronia mineralivorans PML1(12)]|uniref:phospholipase D n=1 Tax=Caballeronia mineralivorans PML1(12) TaxID=908627 RepID=A0A0J1G6A0_9BURK|nr:phospholipase D-like domain-containing protein [Caballeronia mineralivorans]KLU27788.1 phospholipase [Caballeronia mineralivorans PML1(12)]